MKVIAISQPGGADVLRLEERPAPQPQRGQVLIRVHAAGVNRADIAQRKGHYPAPPGVAADIPGLEIAGEVTACGAGALQWKPGDRVCALLAGGGYAEQVVVHEGHCLPVPEGWSFTDAAALPEAILTVWANVFQRGRLSRGESFLVHGGSSGIGMAAIQLAHAFGARVFATAGSDDKCRACAAAGAERAINYRTEDFEAVLKDIGLDVILDMIGAEYLAKNLRLLKTDGRLVFINAMRGAKAEVNLLQIMARGITLTGSTLRSRDTTWKNALVASAQEHVWPLVATRRFEPNVFRVFRFDEAGAAHQLLESSQHIGKLVLAL